MSEYECENHHFVNSVRDGRECVLCGYICQENIFDTTLKGVLDKFIAKKGDWYCKSCKSESNLVNELKLKPITKG